MFCKLFGARCTTEDLIEISRRAVEAREREMQEKEARAMKANKTCPVKAWSFTSRCLRTLKEERQELGAMMFVCNKGSVVAKLQHQHKGSNYEEVVQYFRQRDFSVRRCPDSTYAFSACFEFVPEMSVKTLA